VVARALANQDAADALTEHQAVILDAIRLLNRVEIRGGAGSGKTRRNPKFNPPFAFNSG
jgi:hypothetical protein